MPDFRNYVKDDEGNFYCWDRETQSVVQFTLRAVELKDVPIEVIAQFMEITEKNMPEVSV